jgi:hypothetical protein
VPKEPRASDIGVDDVVDLAEILVKEALPKTTTGIGEERHNWTTADGRQ